MNNTTNSNRILSGFISYSHQDYELCKFFLAGLEKHLSKFKDLRIEHWLDTEIKTGEDWEERIIERINNADFAFLLVSGHFLQSQFITEKEIKWLENRRKQNPNFKIFPILLSPCKFKDHYLSKYQFFINEKGVDGEKIFHDYIFENEGRRFQNPDIDRYFIALSNHLTLSLEKNFEVNKVEKPKVEKKTLLLVFKKVKDIKPNDFDIIENLSVSYFERKIDRLIAEKDENNNRNILLLGPPQVGKTRTVFEFIKNHKRFTHSLILKDWRTQHQTFQLPQLNSNEVGALIIDDIEIFLKTDDEADSMWKIFQLCKENNIKIIATCRTGPERNHMKWAMDSHRINYNDFEKIEIKALSNSEIDSFKQQNSNIGINSFENKMGFIINDPLRIKNQISELVNQSFWDRNYRIASTILEGFKCFYYGLNFELDKNSYDENKIKEYCYRRLRNYFSDEDWGKSIKILEEKKLIIISEGMLYIDKYIIENWVSFPEIMIQTDPVNNFLMYNLNKLKSLVGLLYFNPANNGFNFSHSISDFNKTIRNIINKADSKEKSKIKGFDYRPKRNLQKFENDKILKALETSEINPTVHAYTDLIRYSENFFEAEKVFKRMEDSGIIPDRIAFNALITQATHYKHEKAIEILEKMKAAPYYITPKINTYTTIIYKLKKGDPEIFRLLEEIIKLKVNLDEKAISDFVKKIEFKYAVNYLYLFKKIEVFDKKYFLKELIARVNDNAEALICLNIIEKENLKLSADSYTILHHKLAEQDKKNRISEIAKSFGYDSIENQMPIQFKVNPNIEKEIISKTEYAVIKVLDKE